MEQENRSVTAAALYSSSFSAGDLQCPGGCFYIRRSGGLAPKFAFEILVGSPSSASKDISDKYPKFCPLNFRYDPKIGTFPKLLRLVLTELSEFFLLFCLLNFRYDPKIGTFPQLLRLVLTELPKFFPPLIW